MEKIAEKKRAKTEIRPKQIEQPEAATKEIRKLREEDAVERAPLDNTKSRRTGWEGCPGLGVQRNGNRLEKSCAEGKKK